MNIGKAAKFNSLNESGEYVNKFSTDLLNRIGVVQSGNDEIERLSIIEQVNIYLKRFPEVEYLIDMLASSVIYTSSSNTKKIQITLNGEYKVITPASELQNKSNTLKSESSSVPVHTDTTGDTTADETATTSEQNTPNIEIKDVNISSETIDKVDSWYKDINLEVNNLFRKNNIKLSLYNLMSSLIKYGCGIFYVEDPVT